LRTATKAREDAHPTRFAKSSSTLPQPALEQ
jgi:hypothetical protein